MKSMKRKTALFLICAVIIGLVGITPAYATGYNVGGIDASSVVCPSSVRRGEIITCTFTINTAYGFKRVCGLENEFLDVGDIVSTKYGVSIYSDKIPYPGEMTYEGNNNCAVTIDTTDVPAGTYRFWIIYSNYVAGISKVPTYWYYYTDITVTGDGGTSAPGTTPTTPVPSLTAAPTSSTVLVNGVSVAFDAYNIEGNNYFKLRDLAYILNGTEKQFEVSWSGANNAISLTSGQPYTVVGGEMTGKGSGNKTPAATGSKIYLDGREVSFTAYNIEGNNYFKLRDIGRALDFGVEWDGGQNTIIIDTSIGYTPE